MIECKSCGQDMPQLRKELYGYEVCVNCSTVQPRRGRIVTHGRDEEIYTDLELVDTQVEETERELRFNALSDEESSYRPFTQTQREIRQASNVFAQLNE